MINGNIILVDLSKHRSLLARILHTVSKSQKVFQIPNPRVSLVKLEGPKGQATARELGT